MTVTVTIDTNVFQQIIRPERFANDRDPPALHAVHDALKAKKIVGFVADPIAHVEQIQKTNRPRYFAGVKTMVANSLVQLPDGRTKVSYIISPDPTAHPGLPGVLLDCIKEAVALGVTVLRCPRVAVPIAPDLNPAWYTEEQTAAQKDARQKRFSEALDQIEKRGVGIAVLKSVGLDFLRRDGKSGEWYDGLALSRDTHDEAQIARAWAEWADGDAIAAHIAYENELFCTRDEAVSAGLSILNSANQVWLKQRYDVTVINPTNLAAAL